MFSLICVAAVTLTACVEYPYGGGYGYSGYGGNTATLQWLRLQRLRRRIRQCACGRTGARCWVGDVNSAQGLDSLSRWPTLAALQRARPSTVRQFYRTHYCRTADVIAARLAAITAAHAAHHSTPPFIEPLLPVRPSLCHATPLAPMSPRSTIASPPSLRCTRLATSSRASLGAGAVCAPRLAAAFGTDRTRWQSPAELQAHGRARALSPNGAADRLGPPPAGVSQIRQADLSRIRRPVDPLLAWGSCVLRSATRPRQRSPTPRSARWPTSGFRILFRCWKERATRTTRPTTSPLLQRRGFAARGETLA